MSLNSKSLLLVVPHFKVFIRDQSVFIRPYFKDIVILMPIPHFSSLVLRLPHISRYFESLRLAVESSTEVIKGFNLISPKFFTLPIKIIRERNCYLALSSSIRSLSKNPVNFDLVHVHFLDNGLIGVELKNLYGKPLVVTAHGSDVYEYPFRNNYYNRLAKYILNKADQIITVCQFNAEKIKSLGVSPKKVHVIPNGYNEKLFKPIPQFYARNMLNLPNNKRILLSVGFLVYAKGHTYLINAMKSVIKQRPDTILVIVGSGSLKETLEREIMRLNLGGKVFLVGKKNHEEIAVWMNAADLFVLPSLNEGFPTVIPEAMACGKPVVATSVGGIPEIVSSEELGILVPPKDSEALAKAILEALNKKWYADKILGHAKQYSWSNLAKKIIMVYEKALVSK